VSRAAEPEASEAARQEDHEHHDHEPDRHEIVDDPDEAQALVDGIEEEGAERGSQIVPSPPTRPSR